MPKVLRHDAVLFQLGTSYKQVRKDRDNWEIIDRPDDALVLYYEDIRPTKVLGKAI